jgi:hypothetical protein
LNLCVASVVGERLLGWFIGHYALLCFGYFLLSCAELTVCLEYQTIVTYFKCHSCSLLLLIKWIWYFCSVLKSFLCSPVFMIPVSSVKALCNACVSMWLEYPELPLLFYMAKRCSIFMILKLNPVYPLYPSGQSRHFFGIHHFIFVYLYCWF